MMSAAHCCMCACQLQELKSAKSPTLRCCKQTLVHEMVDKPPLHLPPLIVTGAGLGRLS